jgi:integrase
MPYLQREKTRHGKTVWRVRLSRSTSRITIHGDYGSPQFMAEYHAAVAGEPMPAKHKGAHKGSLQWLADRWHESSDWHLTAKSTQRQRENILSRILADNGALPFNQMTESAIVSGRERRMKTPFAANNFLKTMKALFAWAKEMKLIAVNPAENVSMLSRRTEGHEPWTALEVEAYRARWAPGTRQRVAMELLYWTGLRRGDAVRLGRQHIGRDGNARIKAEKTGKSLSIPMAAQLLDVLAKGPIGDLTFIVGENGRPLSKEGFGNMMRSWCNAAGVKKSSHGLRKLAAIEVAEQGGSEMELNALFGWSTKEQSGAYTRNARQDLLSAEAMAKREKNNSIPTPLQGGGKQGENGNDFNLKKSCGGPASFPTREQFQQHRQKVRE